MSKKSRFDKKRMEQQKGYTIIDNLIIDYRKELGITYAELGFLLSISRFSADYSVNFSKYFDDVSNRTRANYLNDLREKGLITTKKNNYKKKDGVVSGGLFVSLNPLIEKAVELYESEENFTTNENDSEEIFTTNENDSEEIFTTNESDSEEKSDSEEIFTTDPFDSEEIFTRYNTIKYYTIKKKFSDSKETESGDGSLAASTPLERKEDSDEKIENVVNEVVEEEKGKESISNNDPSVSMKMREISNEEIIDVIDEITKEQDLDKEQGSHSSEEESSHLSEENTSFIVKEDTSHSNEEDTSPSTEKGFPVKPVSNENNYFKYTFPPELSKKPLTSRESAIERKFIEVPEENEIAKLIDFKDYPFPDDVYLEL